MVPCDGRPLLACSALSSTNDDNPVLSRLKRRFNNNKNNGQNSEPGSLITICSRNSLDFLDFSSVMINKHCIVPSAHDVTLCSIWG